MSDEVKEIRLPPWVRELERGAPWYSWAAVSGLWRRMLRRLVPSPPEGRVVAVLWAVQDWSHEDDSFIFRDLIRIELRLADGWTVRRELDMTMYLQDYLNPNRPPFEDAQQAVNNHRLVQEVKRVFMEGTLDQTAWRRLECESARKLMESVTEQWTCLRKI